MRETHTVHGQKPGPAVYELDESEVQFVSGGLDGGGLLGRIIRLVRRLMPPSRV